MVDFTTRAIAGVQKLSPYQPGKPTEALERELGISNILKLASNENPLGAGALALDALANSLKSLELYPDGSGFRLKAVLAEKLGVSSEQITLGNGSNDVLELIARGFLDQNRGAVFSEHAFAVYPLVTQAIGAELQIAKAYPADHATMPYGHDLDALLARIDDKTAIVFIANPNNPTGTWLEKPALQAFLQQVPEHVLVVLDEAYIEYSTDSDFPNGLEFLAAFPNLIVTRTFSKIHGLAAVRVGYAVSSPAVADILNRVRQPFNVNSLALAAAEAALADDKHIQQSCETNAAGLQQWHAACKAHDWSFIPSMGNFITVDTQRDAAPLYTALLHEGVIVRPVANYGLPQHLRITIGTQEQNQRCIEALAKVLSADD